MTQNNYPEGLDELAVKCAARFGINYIPADDMPDFARALLDAMAERGYVLVDAKKQEPIGEMREGGVVWYGPNPHAFPIGTNFYAAIPGRVALPDGWKLVPVEPTTAMLAAGMECATEEYCYRAMLSAAPTPPTQPQGDGSLRRDAERYELAGYEWVHPEKGMQLTREEPPEHEEAYEIRPVFVRIDAAMEASNGNA